MRIFLVAVLLAAACADDGVRHTPDAAPHDAAADAAPDAALPPAMLSISPGPTAFGDVVLGQASSAVTYTVTNDGEQASGTLGALLDDPSVGFALANNTCSGVTLQPHGTCSFDVSFSPVAAGAAMTTVRVSATPGGEVTRDLSGNGLQPGALDIVEAGHDFLTLAVDATPKTHTFVVTNTGQVPTGVPMPQITGTVDSYAIASTTCIAALAPMATCNVVVRFDPSTVGSKPGSLVVSATPGGADGAMLAGIGNAHVAVTAAGNGTGTVTSNMTGIDCGSACAADFTATPVVLTATPDTGATFAGWGGDCTGTGTCSLDLDARKAVTATFTLQQFALTTSTLGNGSGTITANPSGGTYNYGTVVTLTPHPATGSTFTGWGGDCSGTGACSVTMTQNHAVTADFTLIPETLNVSVSGGGSVASSPGGITCGNDCTETYGYGTQVVLQETPDPGWVFAGWASGGCTGTSPTCTVTMDQARTVTARFTQASYTFSIAFLGDTSGTVTVNGTTTYSADTSFTVHYGDTINLTATATNGIFWGWGGACASQGNNPSCTVSVTGDTAVSAEFDFSTYRYIVTATTQDPSYFAYSVTYPSSTTTTSECGSQTSPGHNCAASLPRGTFVSLTAHLAAGGLFSWHNFPAWTGCDAVSTDGLTCTFKLLSFRQITVTGDAKQGP
jgi:uncharacterized repeat protein (TIGR02543 family)